MQRPTVSILVLAMLALGFSLPSPGSAEDRSEASFLPHTPTEWLVIEPVDFRSRRPFNPDAVFERHLLDRDSPAPEAGQTLTGERGEPKAWKALAADEKGRVAGRIAWAYSRVEAPEALVAMAWLRSGGTLFVNGTPHSGAVYGDRFEVPVKLEKGVNHVYVRGVRGGFTLTLSRPPAGIFLAPFRQTKPDLVAGEACDTAAGLLAVNAREQGLGQVVWELEGNEWLEPARSTDVLPIAPLGLVQIRVPLRTRPGKTVPAGPGAIEVPLRIWGAYAAEGQDTTLTLDVRPREQAVIRTFVSQIDDSVQRFGLKAPAGESDRPMGLVLTLHGAGVNPRGQVNAYAAKSDFWIAAPTNRDRFGFDWQDWGRLDAYEVLEEALRISGVERSRVYLTGHSMGGHGTWHLGANDPDGFAAIAPSAGWISFDTYPGPRRTGALTSIWHAADGASRTRDLLDNLVQLPTFVLHGEKDDNVPAAQAHEMVKLLTAAGAPPESHFEPDKKHWWDGYPEPGAQCVDWPGIFEMFRATVIPEAPRSIRFRTVHPSVDDLHHWVFVDQVLRYGEPAEVEAAYDPETKALGITTRNVRCLVGMPAFVIEQLQIDGQTVAQDDPSAPFVVIRGPDGDWTVPEQDEPGLPWSGGKKAVAGGPLRQAFTRRFVFVHGTAGNDRMDQALLEQARFDAQRWMYRANGQGLVLPDTWWLRDVPRMDLRLRNPILYGHRFSNRVLRELDTAERPFPLRAASVGVSVGTRHFVGPGSAAHSMAAYGVLPGPKADQLLGILASTSVRASRLGFTTMLFVSGAGWPDYVVFDEGILTKGDGGVHAAGWFDHAWRVQPGGFRREPEDPVSPRK